MTARAANIKLANRSCFSGSRRAKKKWTQEQIAKTINRQKEFNAKYPTDLPHGGKWRLIETEDNDATP